jgi:hypothetical protein
MCALGMGWQDMWGWDMGWWGVKYVHELDMCVYTVTGVSCG